jgi:hypothetical protein
MAMESQRFKKYSGIGVTAAISRLHAGVRVARGARASDFIAGQANAVDGDTAMH